MRLRRLLKGGKDDGVTMVEFALVASLLLVLALGTFEYGMMFRDWLSVTISAREGGRVAGSAANHGDADCIILEAAVGALQSLNSGRVTESHIYKSDENGSYPGANAPTIHRYRPANPEDTDLMVCNTSEWVPLHIGGSWHPSDRVDAEGEADWIGVRVVFEHDWLTNFLWWNGTVTFADDAIFRIEPPPPDAFNP